MNKFLLLWAISFLLPFISHAQSNYHQGYVVLSSGDTTRGYINSREWERTPKVIEFKNSLADRRATSYKPGQLKSFGIADADKYLTYIGKISMDATDVTDAPSKLDTTTRQDTIFLRILYAGSKVSLLMNKDELKQRMFIQQTGQQPVELSYHQYYETQISLASTVGYQSQLQSLANEFDAPENISRLIPKTSFSSYQIEQVLRAINQEQKTHKSTPNGRIFIGGGVANTITSFNGGNPFANAKKSNYVAPFISFGFDAFQNPHTQRLVFRAEAVVSYNAPQFSRPIDYIYNGTVANYRFNQFNVGVIPQFIYNFYNKDNLKVYLNAGMAFNFSSYSNNKYFISGTSAYDETNYYVLKKSWVSFPFKAGILLNKRLEIFAVYSLPASISDYVNFSINTQTLGIGAHYCFDRTQKK